MTISLPSKPVQQVDQRPGYPRGEQLKRDIAVTVDGTPTDFTLTARASELAVRDTLLTVRSRLLAEGVSDETSGSVELAMAEALNNIVEHAYATGESRDIMLKVSIKPDRLCFLLCDGGAPLPGLCLPQGKLPDPSGPRDDLPEGGFGWFLIRDLAERVAYERRDGMNHLTLEFLRAAP
ncbi:serine/threonine-protein kinase RsbW [Roseovarius lutimaris]|uniref:Serine/threonine-protein kinase RsbW n=1 Tax=Roseovarius lutimaris TaxID=1005928 RepID=A0A1I5GH83_9RHOB|nr:serine/threonine-protein kinase RsbW [Roseovarius lutimaris]